MTDVSQYLFLLPFLVSVQLRIMTSPAWSLCASLLNTGTLTVGYGTFSQCIFVKVQKSCGTSCFVWFSARAWCCCCRRRHCAPRVHWLSQPRVYCELGGLCFLAFDVTRLVFSLIPVVRSLILVSLPFF